MRVIFIILISTFSIALFGACTAPGQPEAKEPLAKGAGESVANGGKTETAPPPAEPREEKEGLTLETVYTDLTEDRCSDVEEDEAEEWSVQTCSGIGEFSLRVSEGDLRQTIDVVFPDGSKHELEMWTIVSSGFSTVGDKAEWRINKMDGKSVPVALIVRYNVNSDPEDTEKITSYLTVSKITEDDACITDVIKPIRNANERARELAETAATRPCLTKPTP